MVESASEQWSQYLKEYEASRRSTYVPQSTAPPRMRHKDMKQRETMYNPILQAFNDPQQESKVKAREAERFVSTLAKNKDNALRYEQTFNIVNLSDKLKGLEDKPGYPRNREVNLGREDVTKTNTHYNIISNLDFADHHYLPPDKRPPRKVEERPKTQTISAIEYKDYDMVAHRYLRDHEAKTKYDQEYYRAEAAQKYWQTHDFDPVVGSFIDPDKEQAFAEAREAEARIHGLDQIERLPKSIKYSESALFNPINCKVVDGSRLEEIDMKHKNAKMRYGARYGFEKICKDRDVVEEEKEQLTTVNRVNHRRFMEHRDRGYNIISLGPFEGRFAEKLHDPYTKPKESLWQRALNEAQPAPQHSPSYRARPIERGDTVSHDPRVNTGSSSRASDGVKTVQSSRIKSANSDITFINEGRMVANVREVATPAPPRLRSSGFKRDCSP